MSGISSGAFMANQLHIAHSAGIMGAGIIAGGLYGCAVDSVTSDGVFSLASLAVGPCMSVPTLLKRVAFYAQVVADLAAQGWIDPPSNLARSHVYMFTGQADQVVNFKTVELGASLYRTLGVPESQIVFRDRDLPAPGAGHSWVTKNFGNTCAANASPFINSCIYDQAEDILSTIYGPLLPPGSAIRPHRAFDQTEFVPGNAAEANGMSDTGYLYIPKACEPGAAQPCRLHVALHGCLQSAEVLGNEFYTKVGVNEWADTNGIIVLYPQAHATDGFGAIVAELLIAIQHQPGRLLELVGLWQRRAVSDQARRADQRDLVDGASGDRAAQLDRDLPRWGVESIRYGHHLTGWHRRRAAGLWLGLARAASVSGRPLHDKLSTPSFTAGFKGRISEQPRSPAATRMPLTSTGCGMIRS